MSTSGYAARTAAAAFVIGVSLGAPLAGSLPTASADSTDASASSNTDTTVRGPRASTRTASQPPRAASAHKARVAQTTVARSAATRIRERAATPVENLSVAPPQASAATTVAEPVRSQAAVANSILGPGRSVLEGAALLARRAIGFNKTPTVNPVQLTGQTEGPITGTIGAGDPGRGRLAYAVTGDPSYGTVTLAPDGGYTYSPGTDFAGTDSFVVTVTLFRTKTQNPKRAKSIDASVSVMQGAVDPTLQFQFVYGSGANYWSPEARSSLEAAARRLAQYIVVDSPVTITYSVTGERKPLSGTLASAGSDFVTFDPGFVQTIVQSKIQTGVDPNGDSPDGEITWNFGPKWGYGNAVGNTEYDFESTAMHELTHTLGFLSYTDKPGNNRGKTWTVYDSFLVNSIGEQVIGRDYTWKTSYNANLTGGDGGLYFGGPNAVAAYGGPVPLYTPSPWSSGSSMSHLDDPVFTGPNEKLMNAVSGSGLGVRVLSPAELGILADLGYHITPGSSMLLFVGLVGLRRPRRRTGHGRG